MYGRVAKVAVSAATYWIDRPYDYLVDAEQEKVLRPGMRVTVPFSRGNRKSEGVVLAIAERSEYETLKPISAILDTEPVLSESQIRLGLFMHERFFCTAFEAYKAMLPAGLWFTDDGERRAHDKTVQMVRLAVSGEEAEAELDVLRRTSKAQARILDILCAFEALPVSEVLKFASAGRPSLKALVSAGWAELYEREVFRRPEVFCGETDPLPTLNEAQQAAFEGIEKLACEGKSGAALLFGVTGSGKTSVYIHLIKKRLDEGRSALLLVPEIALTPQMIATFSSYFGDDVAVLHSSLSVAERYDEWKRIRQGRAHVIIGTRSAVFAPCEDLGLIIIDEEQEESYRSESTPRYNAVDIAKYRCAKENFLLLLGSATPDVVSRYKAQQGVYAYFELPERYNAMELPRVSIVDMKKELRSGNGGSVSSFLREEIQKNLDCGEQTILFINRRGTNNLVTCVDCGFTYECPRCSVNLTYHGSRRRFICHYCGFSRRLDDACPDCGGTLTFTGTGTQKVAEELGELFPGTEVMRVDTDTVTPAGSHEKLFDRFRREKIPLMVGTQMVTKGLNFENVTLVGVLNADQSLHSSNYRSSERTFSLITQVVGRSGRGEKPGRAVIQTFTPENETVVYAARQDYPGFYQTEILSRRLRSAPPFTELLSLTASGQDEQLTLSAIRYAAGELKSELAQRPDAEILGPAPLNVLKVNDRFRYRVIISCNNDTFIRRAISAVIGRCSTDKRFRGVSFYADCDPTE